MGMPVDRIYLNPDGLYGHVFERAILLSKWFVMLTTFWSHTKPSFITFFTHAMQFQQMAGNVEIKLLGQLL